DAGSAAPGAPTPLQAVAAPLVETPVALYDLSGRLLRQTLLPSSLLDPATLRTLFGVPAGRYILVTPAVTHKIQL
ncbi:MAG: hypothetical protein LBB27_04280, partial [Tannerellaceae bacterium]|nr:hypothetical protein [Tannerellaceae bacterium]